MPTVAMIRNVLNGTREHLLGTLRDFGDDRLDEIPGPCGNGGSRSATCSGLWLGTRLTTKGRHT